MRKLLALAVVAILAGPWVELSADQPPQYFVNEANLPFPALAGTSTTRLYGVHGGAGYRIEVPDNWNGDLVVYAHGFRGTGLELTVSNPSIRSYLVQHGYAWAASSYGKNGYDVREGDPANYRLRSWAAKGFAVLAVSGRLTVDLEHEGTRRDERDFPARVALCRLGTLPVRDHSPR